MMQKTKKQNKKQKNTMIDLNQSSQLKQLYIYLFIYITNKMLTNHLNWNSI
jgi:hypothetical protein